MPSQIEHPRTFSFEFFPPKTPEGMQKLRTTRKQLAQLNPKFFSVTFGAGGSTRDRTLETVVEIQSEGLHAAPHLSCIGSTRDNIRAILAQYRAHGIKHIVALRGDLPSGTVSTGEFRYANELVSFIREESLRRIKTQSRSWRCFTRPVSSIQDSPIRQNHVVFVTCSTGMTRTL